MVLKKRFTILSLLAINISLASDHAEFRDFFYKPSIIVKADKSFVEFVSELFTESDIESETNKLRTFSQKHKTVHSMRALRDRVRNDINVLYNKVYELGFYNADIQYRISSSNPVLVDIAVNLGDPFNLKLNIDFTNSSIKNKYNALFNKALRNYKASTSDIYLLIDYILHKLKEDGYAHANIMVKKATVHHSQNEVMLYLLIDAGDICKFANTTIKSFPGISEEFIRNRIDWHDNEQFDISKIESTTKNLKNTQIFSRVSIKADKESPSNESISMIVKLEEEKKHTISMSLLYSGIRSMNFENQSDSQRKLKSILTRLSWSRNNAFGKGEKIKILAEGTPLSGKSTHKDFAFEVSLFQPDVFIRNCHADYNISRRQELTNAFFKKSDKCSAMFRYPIKNITIGLGATVENIILDSDPTFFEHSQNNRRYQNASIPVEIILDKTDDILNPTSGYRSAIVLENFFLHNANLKHMNEYSFSFSYNQPLDQLKKTIAAFNVKLTKISGKDIHSIPLDKRIYAGGINSVRGYANQMATEIINGYKYPFGGKSSIEFNSEIRRKISKDLGLVIFCDGAKVFGNHTLNSNIQIEKKRWFLSLGTGIRYFTSIGPIRADFAFPIKRRKGIDSKMQFIISLGQAF